MNIVFFVVCLAVLGVAAYTDVTKNKIPNELFYPVLALSVAVPFVYGIWEFLLRIGIVILVFFVYEGFVTAGDAKLFMMLVMLASPIKAVVAMIFAQIGLLAYSFIQDPETTKTYIMNAIVAIKTFNIKEYKGKGSTGILAPFLAAGFIIATLIYGI